jgi:hypothetical protein
MIADVIVRNAADQFDHIPVVDDNRIVGLLDLVPFNYGEPAHGKVSGRAAPISEENLIGTDAGILSFIRDADAQSCRLVGSRREIAGLVTLSDLQRLPARAALFAMITYLEMTMAAAIRREAERDWISRLSGDRQNKLRDEVSKAKSSDSFVDALVFTQFADKAAIIKKSPTFSESRTSFKSAMHRIEALRNDVAHAADYAATRDAATRVCATVREMDHWIERLSAWHRALV